MEFTTPVGPTETLRRLQVFGPEREREGEMILSNSYLILSGDTISSD